VVFVIKRKKDNPVLRVECRKWVHEKCSGVKGLLKKRVFFNERCTGKSSV
jgi:hypothetical protein